MDEHIAILKQYKTIAIYIYDNDHLRNSTFFESNIL
jgi:hypothetical protein